MYEVELILRNDSERINLRCKRNISIKDKPEGLSEADFVSQEINKIAKSFDGFKLIAYQQSHIIE